MINKNREDIYAVFFILGTLCINLAQSARMDLSHDEAYYWVYSLFPSWGHYDHPPMVGWLIYLGSFWGKSELGVRFPFVLMQAATFWVLWVLGGRRNVKVFAISLLAFPLLQVGGFLALPDTPLVFFSSIFWLLADSYRKRETAWHIPVLSAVIACMLYSKYHALIVLLLTVVSMPAVAKRSSFWIVVAGSVLLYLPHLVWQYSHSFISLNFHLSKRPESHFELENILTYVGGQLALGGLGALVVGLYLSRNLLSRKRMLVLNSLGLFGFFFIFSFRNKIEANWTATSFAALVPLFCGSIETFKGRRLFISFAMPAAALVLGARVLVALPYQGGSMLFERLAEVKGWREKASAIFESAKGYPLYAQSYQLASKLSFYGDKMVPALSLDSRESEFSLLKLHAKLQKNDRISFVGNLKVEGSRKVETGYKGPVFVLSGAELANLLEKYGEDYEKVIRDRSE